MKLCPGRDDEPPQSGLPSTSPPCVVFCPLSPGAVLLSVGKGKAAPARAEQLFPRSAGIPVAVMIEAALLGLVHATNYPSEVQRTTRQWSVDVYVRRRLIGQRARQSTPYVTDMATSARCRQHRWQTRPVCMQFRRLSCATMSIVDKGGDIARGQYVQLQGSVV